MEAATAARRTFGGPRFCQSETNGGSGVWEDSG